MPTDSEIHTLHRYFVWANRLRDDFQSEIQSQGPPPSDKMKLRHWLVRPFAYFSMWMAMLYVVCEGWSKLGMVAPSVESLLSKDRLQFLRRYRNGVFHFQKTYFDRRFTEFIDQGDAIGDWADNLHLAISEHFLKWYRKKGYRYTVKSDADSEYLLEIWKDNEGKELF
ncbi:MAG: hypothetical protein ACYS80_24840 [Planctomycetota bacterium]